MKIVEKLHVGLVHGVTRHWRYTKETFGVKPEYLMTISVADALSEGYDDVHGLDVLIRLEYPTNRIAYQLVKDFEGLNKWFECKKKDVKIARAGRVDILTTAKKQSQLVEIKGFDPSKAQIEKELTRILELFALNAGRNALVAAHLVFPSQVDCQKRIEGYGNSLMTEMAEPSLQIQVLCKKHETNEDPEYGMPVYFTNTLSIVRVDTLSSHKKL
jgi:hypothetical protein